jgi:hypothetical protein
MDSFLLNKKGLEEMFILPKNFCNMHIAHCNMHIAIESILPLTHVPPAHAQRVFSCHNIVPARVPTIVTTVLLGVVYMVTRYRLLIPTLNLKI